jgi:hypothetical protein
MVRSCNGNKTLRWLGTLFLLLSFVGVGCNTSQGGKTVSGKVSYNGKTLNWGKVSFLVSDKTSRVSDIGPDGSYTIGNVPPGPASISVSTQSEAGPAKPQAMKDAPAAPPVTGEASENPMPRNAVLIPNKYADPRSSGLTYEVTKEKTQTHDIDIK